MEEDIPIESVQNIVSVIPLKIFQTWKTKNLPEKMKKTVEELKYNNPEFEHFLFDDHDCLEFIKKHFDEKVFNSFLCLIPGAFKADLWRYCVIYIHGGIYLDIKMKCVNEFKLISITDKEYGVKDLLLHPYEDDKYKGVWNGLIVSKPGNEKLLWCINKIVEHVENNHYGNGPYDVTGPVLFGNSFTIEEKMNFNLKRWKTSNEDGVKMNDTLILEEYTEYRKEKEDDNTYYLDLWWRRKIFSNKMKYKIFF